MCNEINCILSKNKKYPGNTFHARVNTEEHSLLSNVCLETWTIWLYGRVDHFDFFFFFFFFCCCCCCCSMMNEAIFQT